MKIVLFGYGEMGIAGFDFLHSRGEEILAVVTHRDDPGEKRWFRSLAERAQGAGVPVHYEQGGVVERLRPDLILSFYYRDMIPTRILRLAPRGAMNLHGS